MKILQLNTVYKNGGSTGRICHDLQHIHIQNGFESYVAYGYKTSDSNCTDTICLQGWWRRKWNILKTRLFAQHGFYNVTETKRLIEYINQIKPDIIHLHNIHNHYVHVGMLFNFIKQNKIPVVWTLHDCWSFTGWCAYFDYVHCEKWKNECHHCPCKHDYPFTWFLDKSKSNYYKKRKIFNEVDNLILISPSQWLADLTRMSFLKGYPVKVINNGVDTNVFYPIISDLKKRLGIIGKRMILAIAAQLAKRKGAEYLLKIPERLNDNEILVLLGLTSKQIKSLPKDKCIGIAYTNSVQELAEYYSATDVFINPTLEDNFPTTNVEALACGTPIVTFRTGGSVEVIDENTGLIVEQGDLNGLLDATRLILDRGKDLYSVHCREKAVRLYDKEKQYLKYIDLYKSILHE